MSAYQPVACFLAHLLTRYKRWRGPDPGPGPRWSERDPCEPAETRRIWLLAYPSVWLYLPIQLACTLFTATPALEFTLDDAFSKRESSLAGLVF